MSLHIIHIDSLDLPELIPYRTLKRPLEHQQQGIFIAEGEKVVRRFLESPLTAISVLLTEEWLAEYRSILEEKEEAINVFVAKKKLLEEIVGINLHQGIMALGKVPAGAAIEEIVKRSQQSLCLVALDGIVNAENMGVIVRNCAAFGVSAIIAGETSCDPYLRRAVRNSMGNVFSIPIVYAGNLAETLKKLHNESEVRTIAAEPRHSSTPLSQFDFPETCCLVFGSEGSGISKEVTKACSDRVMIPMRDGVDSLNVASAAAVVLYEAMRQRNEQRTTLNV
ncbi:MAG: RNA methyltransferase [Bacteroidota bacterium]|nr:RNA methyltransferase [Bacteroidota bacterium]